MPLLQRGLKVLPNLNGIRLACSMHLEIKMVPLVEALLNQGAQIFLTTCNPKTVQNDVVEYLESKGARQQAWRDMSHGDCAKAFEKAIDWEPSHLCEMGADLTLTLLQRQGPKPTIQAGLEATGTGIARLNSLVPTYPIFNWDDVPIKEGLHNRHMVGLMSWHAFLARTGLTLHGKRVAVLGYGLVGRGVAQAARAFGGAVTIVERDPVRAVEAMYAGWDVSPLEEIIERMDVVVTATGGYSVIGTQHFPSLKDGAFLLNVGHHSEEIDVKSLLTHSNEEILPFVRAVQLHGKKVYLFSEGSMANLVAGRGDSLNGFDRILCVMLAGIVHIVGEGSQDLPGLHVLPRRVWESFI